MDSTVHGILQASILEWVAIPFSRGSSWPRDWTQVSHTAGRFLPAEPPGKPFFYLYAARVSITEPWSLEERGMAFTAIISHSVYLIANTLTIEMSGQAYQDDILDIYIF